MAERMSGGELPTWLESDSFEQIVARPAMTDELHQIVRGLQRAVWHSPARLMFGDRSCGATDLQTCALTLSLRSGTCLTVVMFGTNGNLTDRSRTLRRAIARYSMHFNAQKWVRSRWFVAEENGHLAELKLQSLPDRRVWFLQEFDLP